LAANAANLSTDAVEFGRAIEGFKREHDCPHPSWEQVLEVALELGYAIERNLWPSIPMAVRFRRAMDRYRRKKKRPFPLFSEVLEVLVGLGYRKNC
jgi:hypothetical protein